MLRLRQSLHARFGSRVLSTSAAAVDQTSCKKKFYVLPMFPYPSGLSLSRKLRECERRHVTSPITRVFTRSQASCTWATFAFTPSVIALRDTTA